jgi:hypothetical protein
MKFAADRPYTDPEKAARKLIEIANATAVVQEGRIHIELLNLPFLRADGSVDEYHRAGLERAISDGWLIRIVPKSATAGMVVGEGAPARLKLKEAAN